MRRDRLRHEFVEFVPENALDGVLYISVRYATALHRCCCGCGSEVVTPLTPADWTLSFDGETASLSPSVGNWGLGCQSHYWISRNCVRWAPRWSGSQIEAGRARDARLRDRIYGRDAMEDVSMDAAMPRAERSGTSGFRRWLSRSRRQRARDQ